MTSEEILREEIRAWLDRNKPDFREALADGMREYLEKNVSWGWGLGLVDVVKDGIACGVEYWLKDNKVKPDQLVKRYAK